MATKVTKKAMALSVIIILTFPIWVIPLTLSVFVYAMAEAVQTWLDS
jgi:hypothetical protein